MKIIDSHFHVYKSEQAGLMAQGGKSLIGFNGTVEEATKILDCNPIDRIIALAVIPISLMRKTAMEKWPEDITSSQERSLSEELEEKMQQRLSGYNDWLCRKALKDPRMEPAIAADPTINEEYMAKELLSKLETYKIKVIKIHPAASSLSPAYEGYQPIFDFAQEKDLTVISHGGLLVDDPEGKYCSPENFRKVLDKFPNLKLVAAHLAYPNVKGLCDLAGKYKNLFTDISFVFKNSQLTDDEFCDIIRSFGPDRVVFGSDFPWCDPKKDMDRLLRLKLNEKELEMVARQNSIRIFGLD